jgi:hypothetical protein
LTALVLENRTRYVSAYKKQTPRTTNIFPQDAKVIFIQRLPGVGRIETIFDCTCVVKQWINGISTRAGCDIHGDAISFKCPFNNCPRTFETKVELRDHRREGHRI